MATVALTTTPATLDGGSSEFVTVANTGAVDVSVVRGSQSFVLRPTQARVVYPEGFAVTASVVSGTGQVSTAAQAAQVTQAQQLAANTAAIAGLPGTYASIGRGLAPGAGIAFTGTSITAANTDNPNNSHADSWATFCTLASGGTLRMLGNAGHGGYTSTQLLALLQSEVLSLSPQIVGIEWGRNDPLDGNNKPTTTAANVRAAVAAVRATGAFPFLMNLPPYGMAALSAPVAPTVTGSTTGGTMAANTYYYKVTYTNAAGETTASPATSVTTTGSTSSVTVDAAWTEGSSGAKFYVSTDNTTWHLIGTRAGSGQSKYNQRFTDTTGSVAGAVPPGSNTTAVAYDSVSALRIRTINVWLATYARATGIPLVDIYSALVDSTTGLYQTGYTGDGTHPTSARQKRMGDAAWAAISAYVPKAQPTLAYDNVDPLNLFANGCFINGSASLPTSFASYSGAATGFTDTLGTKTGFAGKALQCARTVPDSRLHDSPAFSTGFSAGDVIAVGFMTQCEGAEAGGGQLSIEVRCNGSNTSPVKLVINAADFGPAPWLSQFTVPAGTTQVYVKGPYLNLGTITGSLGQVTFYNVTTGGLLS